MIAYRRLGPKVGRAATLVFAVWFVCGFAGQFPASEPKSTSPFVVRRSKERGHVEIVEGGTPVLRYNFRTVLPPENVKGKKYADPRSDYIHPLYGPDGEPLTVDFAADHPHHRGIYWAWPEVAYKGQLRDLHALQGVFARPVRLVRTESGPTSATVEAESVWKWNDVEPIVTERAIIRAHRKCEAGERRIDLEFRFTALVDGVTVARRGQKFYGGLNFRSNVHGGQKIVHHTDQPDASPRANWGQISGVPKGGKEAVGVAFLEHAKNPHYPGQWIKYPNLAWLQPTFPAAGHKFPLSKDKPLVLRYRVLVRRGAATPEQLTEAWKTYNQAEK